METPTPIATAEDFKARKAAKRTERARPLTLPSGLTVLAQRPGPEWFLRQAGRLPSSMAARVAGSENYSPERTPEDLMKFAQWSVALVSEVVVSPVVRLNPAAGELDPGDIDDEDLLFLTRFAGGEIDATGASLDNFSR